MIENSRGDPIIGAARSPSKVTFSQENAEENEKIEVQNEKFRQSRNSFDFFSFTILSVSGGFD